MQTIGQRMADDLAMRRLSPSTIETYLRYAKQFADRLGKPPGRATREDIRTFIMDFQRERQLDPKTVNVALSALRFLFAVTLDKRDVVDRIRSVRVQHREPQILSAAELRAFFGSRVLVKGRCSFPGEGPASR